jgi:hypothetical protein
MPDFYVILFLKRLDADEKLQYFQLPYIPCRMVSGNEIKRKHLYKVLYKVSSFRPIPPTNMATKDKSCFWLANVKKIFSSESVSTQVMAISHMTLWVRWAKKKGGEQVRRANFN